MNISILNININVISTNGSLNVGKTIIYKPVVKYECSSESPNTTQIGMQEKENTL